MRSAWKAVAYGFGFGFGVLIIITGVGCGQADSSLTPSSTSDSYFEWMGEWPSHWDSNRQSERNNEWSGNAQPRSVILPGDTWDHPSQGADIQAVGFYTRGKLSRPSLIPDAGYGFVRWQPQESARWATSDLVYVIQRAAYLMKKWYPGSERLQIGDASKQSGGKLTGHESHQNGLDIDLAYFRSDGTESPPGQSRFVGQGSVLKAFDLERNWSLVEALISSQRVERIFLDRAIKRLFCKRAKTMLPLRTPVAVEEVLRRLRPYPEHSGHLHVRITCPLKSEGCISQGDVSRETGCEI